MELLLVIFIGPGIYFSKRKIKGLIIVVWTIYLFNGGFIYYFNADPRLYLIGTGLIIGTIISAFSMVVSTPTRFSSQIKNFFFFTLFVTLFYFLIRITNLNIQLVKGVIETFQFPLWAASIGVILSKKQYTLENNFRWIAKISIWFGFFQSIAIVYQKLFAPPLKDLDSYNAFHNAVEADIYGGLFGGYGYGSVTPVVFVYISIIIAFYFFTKVKFTKHTIAILATMLISLILSEGKAGVIGVGMAWWLVLNYVKKTNLSQKTIKNGVVLVLIYLIFLLLNDFMDSTLNYKMELDFNSLHSYFFEYVTSTGTIPKLGSLIVLIGSLFSDFGKLLIGYGSDKLIGGSYSSESFELVTMNSYLGISSRALNRLIYEYGMLGVVLYSVLLFKLKKALRYSAYFSKNIIYYRMAMIMLLFLVMFTVTNYYKVLTDISIGIFIWTLFGVLLGNSKNVGVNEK